MRPAGLLVFDAGSETADGAVFLHAAQKVQHRLLIGPHFAGDVRIRGQGVGELELDNAQDGALGVGKSCAHGRP